MRIDSHQHFWEYNPIRDSWIDESMQVIRRNFLPKDLKPILKNNNINGCVAVQANQSEDETKFLLELAKENPFIKGVIGWVDLCAEDVEERLAYFSENKNLKGVRHIVQAEANDFMLRKDFQNGISKLQQFGLTYDILIYSSQLPAAIKLVEKFPNQAFVVDHLAKPNIKDGIITDWQKEIELLSKFKNVYCKISGMFTEADWNNWKATDFNQYLTIIFNTFGIDRVLFGSDWPVCLLAVPYKQQIKLIENYISKFTIIEQKKIMGENAQQFYKLY